MAMQASDSATGCGAPIRLTDRENEVLTLITLGNSNSEVGEMLFISRRTVEFHLREIYAKLNVHSRIAAYRLAMRMELLRPIAG